ncbi:MAG: hypothetical protein AAGN35_21970 [Bacteroidota bacterium]
MRGRELLQLIKSLTSREKAYIKASFATEKNHAEWTALFDGMARLKTFNKKVLAKSGNLSERRISSLLPDFSRHVVRALGNFQPKKPTDFELELNAAWKLVMRLRNAAAADIMLRLHQRALAVERFDVLLELHELRDVMTEPVDFEGPKREVIQRLHYNLSQYENLKTAFLRLKSGSLADREFVMRTAANSDLLDSEQSALSIRAQALFYWIKTRQLFYQGNINLASEYQERIIAMLQQYAWLKRERDFYLLKEYEPLIGFLFAGNRPKAANQAIFKIGNLPTRQKREELMKWHQIFPLRLSVALQEGDVEKGDSAVADFLQLKKANAEFLPKRFLTKNDYWVAFFLLSKQDYVGARKIVIQLLKEGKSSDFDPIYMPMTRLLAAVLAYEMGEVDELSWQEKTFRMTKAYQETPFYKMVFALLLRLARVRNEIEKAAVLDSYRQEASEMEASGPHARFFHFFDVGNWIVSKQEQCSMLQVFESRALSSVPADEESASRAQNR